MHAIKVLTIFPLMLVGYLVGFIYTACAVGFCAGGSAVESLAGKCYDDLEAKKASRNAGDVPRAGNGHAPKEKNNL